MKQALFHQKGNFNDDYLRTIDLPSGSVPRANAQGDFIARGYEHFEDFSLLPVVTTVVATSAKTLLMAGTNADDTEATKAAKGGVQLSTEGADNDQTYLRGIAETGMECKIRAASQLAFRTVVNIASIADCFASFGVNENPTDPDPSATAGEGALFLFIPYANRAELVVDATVAGNGGLVEADFGNWILHEKVNDADKYYKTSIPVQAGVDYELEVRYNAALKPNFYINGELVRASDTAQTADDKVFAFVGIEACTGAAKAMDVRFVSLARGHG